MERQVTVWQNRTGSTGKIISNLQMVNIKNEEETGGTESIEVISLKNFRNTENEEWES